MAAVSQGDRGSFAVVYAALWPRCRAFARRLLEDEALGDDAAQEALVKLFAQAARYDTARSVTSWALTLTAFEARTLRARRARRREDRPPPRTEGDGLDLRPCPRASPEDSAVARGLVEAALDAVAGLAPVDRKAILDALDERDAPASAIERKRRQRAWARLKSAWRAIHG